MAKKATKRNPKPRTAKLPGVGDPAIPELEKSARNYAEKRDQRQEWGRAEVEAKDELLALMKKHNRKTYRHADIEIERLVEKEKLRVRIIPEDEE